MSQRILGEKLTKHFGKPKTNYTIKEIESLISEIDTRYEKITSQINEKKISLEELKYEANEKADADNGQGEQRALIIAGLSDSIKEQSELVVAAERVLTKDQQTIAQKRVEIKAIESKSNKLNKQAHKEFFKILDQLQKTYTANNQQENTKVVKKLNKLIKKSLPEGESIDDENINKITQALVDLIPSEVETPELLQKYFLKINEKLEILRNQQNQNIEKQDSQKREIDTLNVEILKLHKNKKSIVDGQKKFRESRPILYAIFYYFITLYFSTKSIETKIEELKSIKESLDTALKTLSEYEKNNTTEMTILKTQRDYCVSQINILENSANILILQEEVDTLVGTTTELKNSIENLKKELKSKQESHAEELKKQEALIVGYDDNTSKETVLSNEIIDLENNLHKLLSEKEILENQIKQKVLTTENPRSVTKNDSQDSFDVRTDIDSKTTKSSSTTQQFYRFFTPNQDKGKKYHAKPVKSVKNVREYLTEFKQGYFSYNILKSLISKYIPLKESSSHQGNGTDNLLRNCFEKLSLTITTLIEELDTLPIAHGNNLSSSNSLLIEKLKSSLVVLQIKMDFRTTSDSEFAENSYYDSLQNLQENLLKLREAEETSKDFKSNISQLGINFDDLESNIKLFSRLLAFKNNEKVLNAIANYTALKMSSKIDFIAINASIEILKTELKSLLQPGNEPFKKYVDAFISDLNSEKEQIMQDEIKEFSTFLNDKFSFSFLNLKKNLVNYFSAYSSQPLGGLVDFKQAYICLKDDFEAIKSRHPNKMRDNGLIFNKLLCIATKNLVMFLSNQETNVSYKMKLEDLEESLNEFHWSFVCYSLANQQTQATDFLKNLQEKFQDISDSIDAFDDETESSKSEATDKELQDQYDENLSLLKSLKDVITDQMQIVGAPLSPPTNLMMK